jgi:mycofactocin biosynthesis protein MftB
MNGSVSDEFDVTRRYVLHPSVAVRPEPFGALVYHYGNRKLVFLKSLPLVALVNSIGQHDSVQAALDALGLVEPARSKYVTALVSLYRSDMLEPVMLEPVMLEPVMLEPVMLEPVMLEPATAESVEVSYATPR